MIIDVKEEELCMAIFRKNIWMIFYILILGAVFFLGIVSYMKWNSIYDKYAIEQKNLVKLLSNAMHSLLLSQETTLDILGHQLLKDPNTQLLDDLVELNPSIVAYGFVDVNGTYLYVNSKFDKTKLPNLRQNPLTKDSFEYTLTQNKMVLGRSYFIPGGGRWGIPIRKTIYDTKPLGVMTAGLSIEGAFRLFSQNLSLGTYNKVTFIREYDRFVQYQSSANATPKEVYASALPNSFFDAILKDIVKTYHISEEAIKTDKHIYLAKVSNMQGRTEQVAIKYDPRYELWTLSQVDTQQIIDDFMESFYIYIFIFTLAHTILFFLFKLIANAEKQRRNDLIYQATHDSLTMLPNRNYLKQEIHHWIYEGAPPFSLYYLDMDHFKSINDSFGHQYGDLLLVEFAKRLKQMVRKDSVVIRQGGDEFLILTYRTDQNEILEHTQRILNEISVAYHVNELSFTVGASIGIARYPEHGSTLDMLLRASDIAMYEAKKQKNSVRFFAPTMQEGYLNRVNLEHALRKALDNKEFFMVYQPQLDTEGNIYGVEALVRWKHPHMGFIPPNEFIPIAEATGLMPKLGHFILTQTLDEMKALQEALDISFQTSINISVKQFMETKFLEKLFHEIESRNVKNIALCLEITESLFIEDVDYILPMLTKIRQMGLSISMDDFGTGYSSLSILRKLPIDELKIDKSFIDTLLNDITAQKMIQNIITIGKNLELFILAEGVEKEEQATLLKTFGCDRLQGFLYAKPMPSDELKKFFASHFPKF